MRDVHCSIAAWASQRGHRYAGKWLTPSDLLILARTASDDMGATVHLRLRLVRVASIKGRENLITVAVVNTQAPSMYFLSPDATLSAAHRADILSSIFSPFIF